MANKQFNLDPVHPFIYSEELSRHILSYLRPKQMFIAAHCSKVAMAALNTEDIISNCLNVGGGTMRSIMALYPLMKKGAIYTMSPVRTLELCVGTRCEYCKQSENYTGEAKMTYCVRPTFGIKACVGCLMQEDNVPLYRTFRFRSNSHNEDDIDEHEGNGATALPRNQWALSSRFQKTIDNGFKEYHNQYYLANRQIIYEILSHPRVAAYPTRDRYFDENDNPTVGVDFVRFTRDNHEIMQTSTLFDFTGNKTGAIFTRKMLGELVDYLKSDGNHGIDFFFNNMIPGCPALDEYAPFINAYEKCIGSATLRQNRRIKLDQENRQLRQYKKIELAVKGIAKIARMMSPENIRSWQFHFSNSPLYESNLMLRVMLMYREITYPRARWCLTYDTSSGTLNGLLHSVLGSFLAKPFPMNKKVATKIAHEIYDTTIEHICLKRHRGIYKGKGWKIKQSGYGRRYRRIYDYRSRGYSRRTVYPWRDRSNERVL